MRQGKNNGLRFAPPPRGTAGHSLLGSGLCASMLFSLGTLCGMEAARLLAAAGFGICIAHRYFGRKTWFFPGTLAILVIGAAMFRGAILEGFCRLFTTAGTIYTAQTGMVFPGPEASSGVASGMLFAGWLGALLGLGFSAVSDWKLLPAAAALVMTTASLLIGRMADPLPLILCVMLLCGGGNWKRRILPLLTVASLLLLFSLPGADTWIFARSEQISDAIHHIRYETKYTTLPEGRMEPISRSDSTALIVTMEKPEVLYLRGFTGAQLTDGRWQPLDPRVLAQDQELLYWLNSREFDLRAQFAAAASALETDRNTVTVQNVGACSAYRYLPFTIRADDRLIPENLTDTAAGGRFDSFTTVYGGAAMLPELLTVLASESSRYRQAEAAYRDFVKDHYLSIPEELAQKMQPYWEEGSGMDAQAAAKAVLENCFPDGIRHDPYYATAAVLTLRHFGIPARYAEGYITPMTTATTVELTGTHAACWAEVYHDGIGWLPMEQTGGPDVEKPQQEEPSVPPDIPEETQPPETEPATEEQPDDGDRAPMAGVLLSGVIFAALLLILTAAALILRRRHVLKKKQAILMQADVREAVIWSFADSIRILERMGIRRGKGSLTVLTAPIRDQFGGEIADRFDAASRINAKALFSGKLMTEPERETVHGFRHCVLLCLQNHSSRLSIIWMKYVLCMF